MNLSGIGFAINYLFFYDIASDHSQIYFMHTDNRIIGNLPANKKPCVTFKGTGNTLIIEEGVEFSFLDVVFFGSNATLTIGANSIINASFFLQSNTSISIGSNCKFNKPCIFNALNKQHIVIGNDCLFANAKFFTYEGASILDANHKVINPPASISIGDRVWFAENSMIMQGTNIGNDCVVAACSLILGLTVGSNKVIAGNPAKVIKDDISWCYKRI